MSMSDIIIRTTSKLIAPLQRRVKAMVSRAVVSLVDDSLKIQGLQITSFGEPKDDVERFQQYGFSSSPSPGAEAVVLSVGGNRNHLIVTNVDDRRYRPKNLTEGEVVLYTKDHGILAKLAEDGTVNLGAATASDAVALSSIVYQNLQNIQTALTTQKTFNNTHVHPTAFGPSGPTASPDTSSYTASDPASVKVLVE